MKQLIAVAALCLALLGVPAAAQTSDPVLEHYRAYRAALDSGDLARAETEAVSALAASEARDGDGGRTAVLAFNLAQLRLGAVRPADAVAPAARAFAIAQARGAEAGVDVNEARLVLATSRFATDSDSAAAEMQDAMSAAARAGVSPIALQRAAFAYAMWAFTEERYDESRLAWAIAAENASGSDEQRAYTLGRARVGEGASTLMLQMTSPRLRESLARLQDAHEKLSEGLQLLAPLASADAGRGNLTAAQLAFVDALAWRGLVRSRVGDAEWLRSAIEAEGDAADSFVELTADGGSAPRCALDMEFFNFRHTGGAPGRGAAAVLRVTLDDAGEIVSNDVVGWAGSREFARSVAENAASLRVGRAEDAEPGCRMAMTVFRAVVVRYN